jgi:hypothetical protein
MHVRFDSADFMQVGARRVDAPAAQAVVNNGFDFRDEQRRAFFGVPGNAEVDLGVVIA